MPEILTLVKLKQDNYEFQASLCYTVRPCLTKQNKQTKNKDTGWGVQPPQKHVCPELSVATPLRAAYMRSWGFTGRPWLTARSCYLSRVAHCETDF
jgi:hypothetical protein